MTTLAPSSRYISVAARYPAGFRFYRRITPLTYRTKNHHNIVISPLISRSLNSSITHTSKSRLAMAGRRYCPPCPVIYAYAASAKSSGDTATVSQKPRSFFVTSIGNGFVGTYAGFSSSVSILPPRALLMMSRRISP